jgi:hypothetical protein
MRALGLLIAVMACTTVAAAPAPIAPLTAQEAAVIGGWKAPGLSNVNSLYLIALDRTAGCLRLGPGPLIRIQDHLRTDKPAMWSLHRLKPGLYALAGVGWGADAPAAYMTANWTGLSRQRGHVWTVEVAPGAVTDIGIWTIVSPYPQRFVVAGTELENDKTIATSLAAGAGPLVSGQPLLANVLEARAACPAASSSPPN